MNNSCGSCKHMRAVDAKQNLQFHWPKAIRYYIRLYDTTQDYTTIIQDDMTLCKTIQHYTTL
jgi:hypothetical protein